MHISGLQKLTLLDFPGLMACIVFTKGCNFRCPFCHNAALVLGGENTVEGIDESEFFDFLEKRKGVLDGVVITGGEPLLHKDIISFLQKIKALGFKVKIDTNGTNPALLKEIVAQNLADYVAMDIKSGPFGYARAAGIDVDLAAVNESREFLLSGAVEYEFRTTLVKGIHTKDDVLAAAQWISGAKRYYLQGFKNSGGLISPQGLEAFTETEMKEFAEIVAQVVPVVELRGV